MIFIFIKLYNNRTCIILIHVRIPNNYLNTARGTRACISTTVGFLVHLSMFDRKDQYKL